jgi:hypothetical protein
LKYIPILAVFVTLNSPTIAIWDTWVLSHSISLAYNLFSFVFLLKYLESKALKHLVAFASFVGMLFFAMLIERQLRLIGRAGVQDLAQKIPRPRVNFPRD